MNELYVTITGFCHYFGLKAFEIGGLVRCEKEPDNCYDAEAIRCTLPLSGTLGYLANSPQTVAGGTMSAGRVYDRVGPRFHVRVLFTSCTKVICRVENGSFDDLERELLEQLQRRENWRAAPGPADGQTGGAGRPAPAGGDPARTEQPGAAAAF